MFVATAFAIIIYMIGICYHYVTLSNFSQDIENGSTIKEPDTPNYRNAWRKKYVIYDKFIQLFIYIIRISIYAPNISYLF